jgi:hypothetical protein
MLAEPAGRKYGVPLWEMPRVECGRFAANEAPGNIVGFRQGEVHEPQTLTRGVSLIRSLISHTCLSAYEFVGAGAGKGSEVFAMRVASAFASDQSFAWRECPDKGGHAMHDARALT